MRKTTFINARIVTPDGIITDGRLLTGNGLITAIGATIAPKGEIIDLQGGFLLPGFVDTQCNGGGGVLFNDQPTLEGVVAIAEAHRQYGTTGLMPTLISDDLQVVEAGIRAVDQAIAQGVPGILGIHIEGPFINVARKGTHDETKFRRLDERAIGLLSSLKRGKTLVTLAPELTGAEDIRALVRNGVIVAAGHTNATYAEARQGLEAGISGFTHLYNAMSPLLHRAPGVVGAALEDQLSYCGIIVDGRHVDPAALRIALRCKPHDRFMLVTDAMPTVGAKTKTFRLGSKLIRVENGVCVGPDGTLAGCDLDMATAVRNAMEMIGVDLETASLMASGAPAAFLGLNGRVGSLRTGLQADLAWLGADLKLKAVWCSGERTQRLEAAE